MAPDDKIVNVEDRRHRSGVAGRSRRSTICPARRVHVRKASSYYQSLMARQRALRAAGKPGINVVLVPDALEDEDMLEMLNAGLLQAIVVDDWKAKLWSQVLPKLDVHDDVVLRAADEDRLGDPQEQPAARRRAERVLCELGQEAGRRAVSAEAVHEDDQGAAQSGASADYKRFEQTIALFREVRHSNTTSIR